MDKIIITIVILAIVLVVSFMTLLKLLNYENGNVILHNNIKDVENYSPIPITKYLVFGKGDNTNLPIFPNSWKYFSLDFGNFYILNGSFYISPNISLTDTYYKTTSTSIGDYIPSLIGQKVYLIISSNNKQITSVPYIVKNENIQDNKVVWNMSFDGNINKSIFILNINYSSQMYLISGLKGIVMSNGTALIIVPPFSCGRICSLQGWENDVFTFILVNILITILIIVLVIFENKKIRLKQKSKK